MSKGGEFEERRRGGGEGVEEGRPRLGGREEGRRKGREVERKRGGEEGGRGKEERRR